MVDVEGTNCLLAISFVFRSMISSSFTPALYSTTVSKNVLSVFIPSELGMVDFVQDVAIPSIISPKSTFYFVQVLSDPPFHLQFPFLF